MGDARSGAPARRLRGLPRGRVLGVEVAIATTPIARLLGLALLEREQVGAGLLLPRCRSVHTLGMRFRLDLVFLDSDGAEIRRLEGVRPGRLASERGARSVLELPAVDPPERGRRRQGWG